MTLDESCMRECFNLARAGIGHVSPNPLVGALLMRHGRLIARGAHRQFGGPHAEAECIGRAGHRARGATLYVNLEPCTHVGKTPPCADLIIRSGIREVVVAMKDPNPLVAGRGIRKLRAAGIKVRTGVLHAEARSLNRFFLRHIAAHRPYIHVKIAQSLDGRIAGGADGARWITSLESRTLVHQWRGEYDVVLVGAGTVRADNPRLDTRLSQGRNPAIVVLDGRLTLPESSRVVAAAQARRVILCTSERALRKERRRALALNRRGVLILVFPGDPFRFSLRPVLKRLYEMNIGSILVEGGQEVFTQFLHEGLADEISVFIAPVYLSRGIGALGKGRSLRGLFDPRIVTVRQTGGDILINAHMHPEN